MEEYIIDYCVDYDVEKQKGFSHRSCCELGFTVVRRDRLCMLTLLELLPQVPRIKKKILVFMIE